MQVPLTAMQGISSSIASSQDIHVTSESSQSSDPAHHLRAAVVVLQKLPSSVLKFGCEENSRVDAWPPWEEFVTSTRQTKLCFKLRPGLGNAGLETSVALDLLREQVHFLARYVMLHTLAVDWRYASLLPSEGKGTTKRSPLFLDPLTFDTRKRSAVKRAVCAVCLHAAMCDVTDGYVGVWLIARCPPDADSSSLPLHILNAIASPSSAVRHYYIPLKGGGAENSQADLLHTCTAPLHALRYTTRLCDVCDMRHSIWACTVCEIEYCENCIRYAGDKQPSCACYAQDRGGGLEEANRNALLSKDIYAALVSEAWSTIFQFGVSHYVVGAPSMARVYILRPALVALPSGLGTLTPIDEGGEEVIVLFFCDLHREAFVYNACASIVKHCRVSADELGVLRAVPQGASEVLGRSVGSAHR